MNDELKNLLELRAKRYEDSGYRRVARTGWSQGCPRTLVGKRHLEKCWCITSANDHGATYLRGDGKRVILWEPYHAYPLDMTALFEAARADGLHIRVSGFSPHYPGGTFAIEFEER